MNHRGQACSFFFSLIIFINTATKSFNEIIQTSGIVRCGIAGSLEDITAFFTSVKTFFTTLQSFFSVLGLNTVILFIAVLILSAGLSTLGIPRGKYSLIASLIIADVFWLLWEKSFNVPAAVYAPAIFKSNALLCLPVICISGLKKIIKILNKKVKIKIPGITSLHNRNTIYDIEKASLSFHSGLIKDLVNEKQSIVLSAETKKSGQELIEALKKIT